MFFLYKLCCIQSSIIRGKNIYVTTMAEKRVHEEIAKILWLWYGQIFFQVNFPKTFSEVSESARINLQIQ